MSRGRILLIGPLPPPAGGDTVSTKCLLESEYWQNAGIAVDHIDTSGQSHPRLPEERRSPGDIFRAIYIFFLMAARMPRAEIVLLWANSSFICSFGPVVMSMALILGKPYVIKPFGSLLSEMIDGSGRARRKVTISLLNRARYILPQTDRLREDLIHRTGIDGDRVACFPNFIPDSFLRSPRPSRSFSGKCVFAGHIKKEKGVFTIIEALGGNRDLRCTFYGQLTKRDAAAFLERISLFDNLEYGGVIEPERIVEAIGGHDLLLLPTCHPGEGIPAVILQAFAAGVPVIATRWKSIPEIVRDRQTGILIQTESSAALLDAVELLASDNTLYENIARNAYELAGNYSERAWVGEFLINEVIKGLL